MIECSECGANLGDFKTKPSPLLRWVWLESDEWKTRVAICSTHDPDDNTIDRLKRHKLQSWGLKKHTNIKWGEEVKIEEYLILLNKGVCADCRKPLDEDPLQEGWKLYHKKCRGVSDNRYKEA